MPSYRLTRTGAFSILTTGANHCGTKGPGEKLALKYRVIAACPSTALDSRGFLFDQTKIADLFAALTTTSLSCELLAEYMAREVYRLIRRENAGMAPTSLILALSPEPYGAEIEYEWDGKQSSGTGAERLPVGRVRVGVPTLRGEQGGLDMEYGSLFAGSGL